MHVRVLLAPPDRPLGRATCAVIIDVLRATTTLAHALAHGAARVIPAASVEEARALADANPGALRCGERHSRRIDGFDLGNSPTEYAPAAVSGRTLVFASTNGSLAMRAARDCRRRLIAAFVNATAVTRALAREDDVTIVCAGKHGAFALEDTACAGWLVARLTEQGATPDGAAARLARAIAPHDAAEVHALVRGTAHARELCSMGTEFAADVATCAAVDTLDGTFDV